MPNLSIFGLVWYGLVWFGFVWFGLCVLSIPTRPAKSQAPSLKNG